jgi:hypothetical protein
MSRRSSHVVGVRSAGSIEVPDGHPSHALSDYMPFIVWQRRTRTVESDLDKEFIMPTAQTIVFLDPTSPDGESALAHLHPSDSHLVLVVLAAGPASRALRDFSRSEDVSMAEAGYIYGAQVAARPGLADLLIEVDVRSGPDAVGELADVVRLGHARRVLVPSSFDRIWRNGSQRLRGRLGVPLTVASDPDSSVALDGTANPLLVA